MFKKVIDLFRLLNITSSDDVQYSKDPLDRIVGQEKAKTAMLKALKYNRHVLLVGAPGVGKSAMSKAISDKLKPTHKKLLILPNYECRQQPIAKFASPTFDLKKYQKEHGSTKLCPKVISGIIIYSALCTVLLFSLFITVQLYLKDYYGLMVTLEGALNLLKTFIFAFLGLTLKLMRFKNLLFLSLLPLLIEGLNTIMFEGKRNALAESVIAYDYDKTFIDSTGADLAELFGTVLHDPYVGLFVHTSYDPTHKLVIPGNIHKAHEGILYIDEIGLLPPVIQYGLLTVLQQQKAPISGATSGSGSNSHVKTNALPCNFRLIMAGNYETVAYLHKALRSRIQSYGYEIYVDDKTIVDKNIH